MGRKFGEAKLEKFRQLFTVQKRDLLNSLRQNTEVELDIEGDDTDVVQGRLLSELTSKLSIRDAKKLEKINTALERIDNGSFGKCTGCDEAIGEKRLIALPGCDLCIACAEEEEREQRLFLAKC